MKRKLPLFLATLMMVSALCAPMAYAAPSIGGGDIIDPGTGTIAPDPDTGIEIDENDVPLAEIPEVFIYVDALLNDTTSKAEVTEKAVEDAIDEIVSTSAVRVTIVSQGAEGASKAEVKMPGSLIRDMADTNVELNVVTPVGRALLSNDAFRSILHADRDCDPTLVIESRPISLGHELVKDVDAARIDGGSVSFVYVTCPHTTSYTWDNGLITLYLPVGSAEFVEGNGYEVRHFDVNRKEVETYVGQCILDSYDDQLKIAVPVQNGTLAYFVVLADAVEMDMPAVDPATVVAPLASKPVPAVSGNGIIGSVQHWFDAVANQVMRLFGL